MRYKLALAFLGVCLLAFGVGGTLVTRSARATLEEEVRGRLRLESEAFAAALDADLRALGARVRDFASDGYIRAQFDGLSAGASDVEGALRDHLVRNKLPLVSAFRNLALASPEGRLFLSDPSDEGWARSAWRELGTERDAIGGLLGSAAGLPVFAIATPLSSLDGTRRIGALYAEVHAGIWIAEALATVGESEALAAPRSALRLVDGAGRSLSVPRSFLERPPPRPSSELVRSGFGLVLEERAPLHERPGARGLFTRQMRLATSGWTLATEIESTDALAAVAGLQARFLLVGLVLSAAASLLLVFPMRFLARPLRELEAAARRIRAGDFGARVPVESEDEIGALSSSFNMMAQAVEERTAELRAQGRVLEQRKEELRQERDRLNAVLLSMRDALIVIDAEGRPMLWNAAARPLLAHIESGGRLEPHRLCRTAQGDGGPARNGGAQGSSACMRCLFDPAEPPRSCLIDTASGVFEVRTTRLSSEAGKGTGRVLVAREVSDRVAEDEREIHQERISVLGEVAAVVAHELNNPLAAIRMFAKLVEQGLAPDSPLREDLAVIERNTEVASRTIRDLLEYATGAAPEVSSIDVHATLEDVARFLRAFAKRKGTEVELLLSAEDPLVTGDEVQLRQVFVNLILNALQAIEGGGKVRVRSALEGTHLLVDVEDDGPGIAPGLEERIFRPFFTTKARGEGTGLGLSTARRITEIQGGGLELVQSRPGRTLFRVRLLRKLA